MFIPRHETEVLQEKLNQAIENGIGSTILISGEPGIGKTTLVKNFMDNCDSTSEKNVLTAVGSCLDMDGVSRGFLPWREVLIELDADKAAGKDKEKKFNFKKIVKTVFDEAGSQWLEAIPVIGDISSAIFETARTISKDELIDTETGDSKKLALKDRLKNVAKECTGEWLNVIPVVGNLSAAIYKTTTAIQKSKQVTYSQNQQDFFIRMMNRFRELAETNPVVIYVDDLQWADISSMNLFFYLAKNLKDSPYPLVLIGSFRPEDIKNGRLNPISGEIERHPWEEKINNLNRYGAVVEIKISYLSNNQILDFINLQFPQNEFSNGFKNEIINLTRGNSLFVKELILNLQERGIIFQVDGKFYSDETLDLSTLPTTVSGVIEERFQRLSEDLQEVLQIASVQGSDFSLELISTVLEENNFKLLKKVQDLQQKYSLILKSETVYDKLKKIYEFVHNLVQKYIYYQMSEDFRLGLHGILAETLESFFEGDEIFKVAEQYSFHFGVANQIISENGKISFNNIGIESEKLDKYLKFQIYLAENYRKNYQNEEAINKLFELVEIYKLQSKKEAEVKTKLKISKTYSLMGEFGKALPISEKCLADSEEHNFRDLFGIAQNQIGLISMNQGNFEKALEFYKSSLEISTELGDKAKISETISLIGLIYSDKGELDKAMQQYQKSLMICEELEDKVGISYAYGNMGNIYSSQGNKEKAMECCKKLLEISEEIKNKRGIAFAVGNIGTLFLEAKEYAKALDYLQKAKKISEELGNRNGLLISFINIGKIYKAQGNFEKAIEYFDKSIKLAKELGIKFFLSLLLIGKAEILFFLKNLSEAKKIISEGLEIAKEIGKKDDIFKGKLLSSKIDFALGDKENPPKQLLEILTETKDKVEIADLNYELWKMTSDRKYKIEALNLYQRLYSKTQKDYFKKYIEELEN
ncbi:MAG: tetratricopeptide repeat protein [Calditrichaeota bacterium]|nr:MAG: tetratricopeptide repeat protein [Calditrichota bacterium]